MAGMTVDGEVGFVAGMEPPWEIRLRHRMASGAGAHLGKIGSVRINSVGRDVVGPQGAARGVGGGIDAGEGTEFVSEVGLVVVTAVECQLCPADVGAGVQLANGVLESLDAAPDFGAETHFFAKDLREPALAPADLAGSFTNAGDAGIVREVAKGKLNLGKTLPALEARRKSRGEDLFEALEAILRRFDFSKPIA